jgi:phosphopantothenoylcysteine decarboxylase/phosphopantothenate--cysteine ligase
MNGLTHKKLLLGVTGGIAAYKSADLVRRLREQGAEVRVVMTKSAREFVTPLTFQALSGHPVHTELLDSETESSMGHIELARWCDAVLIAPASANCMARLAHGLADDLLTTLCLATSAPVFLAPAMNNKMWLAQATQANARLLSSRGVSLFGPGEGEQACGETGAGRMLEPTDLAQRMVEYFAGGELSGLHVMVTAGPTCEDLDPVRYITNRSSGRMGYAIAAAARAAGAEVTLISGPVALTPPDQVRCVSIHSAEDMLNAVMSGIDACQIFIAAAAVADYRSAEVAQHKIKKHDAELSLTLARTPDILKQVAGLPKPPFSVGFAAETQNLRENALGKLNRKGLDMIAANQVGIAGQGFDSEDNALHVFWQGGDRQFPLASKHRLARDLISLIIERYREKTPT